MIIKSNNINKYFFVWIGICLVYMLFIGYLTWIFPYGGDEMQCSDFSFFKNSILHPVQAVRIAIIINGFLLQTNKILFVILNMIAQIFTVFSVFYFIYMRFPNFYNFKDLPMFILFLVFGTFFISQPSDTILWIGGALNYMWVFIPFVWFLVYLRKLSEGKCFTHKYFPVLCLFWGAFLGFINENNSPMILCLTLSFIVYAHYKKIVLRKDFWILLISITVSLFFFFKLSNNAARLNRISFGFPMHHTLTEKLFMHLPHMNSFAEGNLWLIYLLPLFQILLFIDKKKLVLQDKNFYLSIIFWVVSFGLAIVLCEAPRVATRAFYSASWFCIISLIFLLLEIEKLYKVRLIKYFAFVFALIFLYIAPLFTLEVQQVKDNVIFRRTILEGAKQKGRQEIYLNYITSLKLLPTNLCVGYYDALQDTRMWSKREGITIKKADGNSTMYI